MISTLIADTLYCFGPAQWQGTSRHSSLPLVPLAGQTSEKVLTACPILVHHGLGIEHTRIGLLCACVDH